MTLQIQLLLFTDNNGAIGESIDSVVAGNSFYVQILVGDFRSDATGLIGFLSSIQWDSSILQSLDDPFSAEDVITPNFPALPDGTLDNTLGLISGLTAGALPEFEFGQAIGVNQLEFFATLRFSSQGNGVITTSNFLLTPDISGLAFTDDYVNNAPVIPTPPPFAENSTGVILVVSDPNPGDTLTFAITGGADQSLFILNSATGELTFIAPPDFEQPLDTNGNNIYEVEITAYDNFGEPATTTLRGTTISSLNIEVTNVNEAPIITSGTSANFAENGTGIVYTVIATDTDAGTNLTYTLDNTLDASLFNINPTTGAITFKNAPDFETPLDNGTNNIYNLTVIASDGSLSNSQAVAITVTDLNELKGNPLINNGRNSIVGTVGSDYITGLAGAKTLTGGGGNDFFVFTNMRDVGQRIADFTVGEDKLIFTQLFSSLGYTGSNPIADSYIKFVQGTGANSAHTFLQIDRDGLTGSAIARNFLQVDNITPTQLNNINNFQF
jgi:hypothetical protein